MADYSVWPKPKGWDAEKDGLREQTDIPGGTGKSETENTDTWPDDIAAAIREQTAQQAKDAAERTAMQREGLALKMEINERATRGWTRAGNFLTDNALKILRFRRFRAGPQDEGESKGETDNGP